MWNGGIVHFAHTNGSRDGIQADGSRDGIQADVSCYGIQANGSRDRNLAEILIDNIIR